MGYAITLRSADGSPIPYARWLAFARADPELVEAGESAWAAGEREERYLVFAWRCGDPDAGDALFAYRHGVISVDHVSDAWVRKIGQVAHALGAVAEGDDGETYHADGNEHRAPRPRGWWARLFGG